MASGIYPRKQCFWETQYAALIEKLYLALMCSTSYSMSMDYFWRHVKLFLTPPPDIPICMNRDQAKTLIRRLANQGCVAFSRHCRDSMADRNVNSDDFLQVLMWGAVLSVKKNSKTGHWKCEISGKDVDGDHLTLQIAIDEVGQRVICVTVY